MKTTQTFNLSCFVMIISLILTACGGSSSDGDPLPPSSANGLSTTH